MLKKIFLLVLIVCAYAHSFAQILVATLQHNDTISAFYGVDAFIDAHNAASDGDVITLSSGTFNGCDITKAIKLHGAGCKVDTVMNLLPTTIKNDIRIRDIANDSLHLIIEGITFPNALIIICNLHEPKFIKCNIRELTDDWWPGNHYTGHIYDGQIINCCIQIIADHYSPLFIINSVIWQIYETSNITAYNSFLRSDNTNNKDNITAYNSIFNLYGLSSNCRAYYCIGIRRTSDHSIFNDAGSYSNTEFNSFSEVFETFDGSEFSYDEQYILRDTITSNFHGTDDTEIGIYGGLMPYNPRPSYMILQRCNVANKSTIDGKLNVDIEVITEE